MLLEGFGEIVVETIIHIREEESSRHKPDSGTPTMVHPKLVLRSQDSRMTRT